MRAAAVIPVLLLAACGGGSGDDAPDPDASALPGVWRSAPDVASGPIQETAVVALDGRLYMIGGFGGDPSVVRVFDTADETWSDEVALPEAVHHANAAVVGDTIYVLGFLSTAAFLARSEVWAFTPGVDTAWRPRAPVPQTVGAAAVGVADGIVYLAGGQRAGTAIADVFAYDPVTDTWDDTLPDLPLPLDHACGAGVGDTMFVLGGRDGATLWPRVYSFTAGGEWTARARMITGRAGCGCGVVDGRIVVVGGEGNPEASSGVFPEAEIFDPATDQWASLAPMPTPRHGMGAAGWDGSLYVPGGATVQGFGAVATHEVLTP